MHSLFRTFQFELKPKASKYLTLGIVVQDIRKIYQDMKKDVNKKEEKQY